MKITFIDRDGKGRKFASALADAGHELGPSGGDVLVIDADPPNAVELADHDRIVLYPHGGILDFNSDGQWPIHPGTVGRFVIGPGQEDVLAALGHTLPMAVPGFPFCDLELFQPRPLRRVLFAPVHPSGYGQLVPGAQDTNARIHDMLLRLDVSLTVRYVQVAGRLPFDVEHLGITQSPSAQYQAASFDIADAVDAVDAADLVIAGAGTIALLAVARGRPTLFTEQHDLAPLAEHAAFPPQPYSGYERFPLDADSVESPTGLHDLMMTACSGDTGVNAWRDRYVGASFDPDIVVNHFEEWVR